VISPDVPQAARGKIASKAKPINKPAFRMIFLLWFAIIHKDVQAVNLNTHSQAQNEAIDNASIHASHHLCNHPSQSPIISYQAISQGLGNNLPLDVTDQAV
jgi:hypothetical protein